MNGDKVIDFDYKDPRHKDEVELLRLRGADLDARGSYLYLQDHGKPVWYRSITLRERSIGETLDSSIVIPAKIPAPELKIEQEKLSKILEQRKLIDEQKKNKSQNNFKNRLMRKPALPATVKTGPGARDICRLPI